MFKFMDRRSRSELRQKMNLGIIGIDRDDKVNVFRDKKLELLDSYYENRQYDHLPSWEQTSSKQGGHLSVRQKKPRIQSAFAKTLSQRLTSKLIGTSVFPQFNLHDYPDDQAFLRAVVRESALKYHILEPTRRMVNTGSVLYRYYLEAGAIKSEWYNAKYCYPVFQPNGELQQVTIKYVWTDENEKDDAGHFVKKWWKMDLMMDREILYDNPKFEPDVEPEFQIVSEVVHDLGFVQAEWMKTCEMPNTPDGYGIVADIMDFIDEINYSISQSSNAISFNQDPQLVFSQMTEDELANVFRSSFKSWNLGLKGKAEFLESKLDGVKMAIEMRDKVRLNLQDITRIVLLDPDKIVGSAQSGKAMEVLHGPLKDLVDELRMPMERSLKKLVTKMAITVLIANSRGIPVPIEIPPGYKPQTIDFDVKWPPIFAQTTEDLHKKVQMVSAATSASLISRETGTRYLAEDFNIENVDEELQKIASQPVLNPFGGF